jgi:hypothetical protein
MYGPPRTRAASSIVTIAVSFALSLLVVPLVEAQDETGEFGASPAPSEPAPVQPAPVQPAPVQPAPSEPAPAATAATGSAQPAPAQPVTASPAGAAEEADAAQPQPTAAPIMVVVLTSGRAPEEIAVAARDAVIAQVTPMTGGRPVLPLMAPALRDAIAACAEPTCIGGHIAGRRSSSSRWSIP